jgi:hypothetical protein
LKLAASFTFDVPSAHIDTWLICHLFAARGVADTRNALVNRLQLTQNIVIPSLKRLITMREKIEKLPRRFFLLLTLLFAAVLFFCRNYSAVSKAIRQRQIFFECAHDRVNH